MKRHACSLGYIGVSSITLTGCNEVNYEAGHQGDSSRVQAYY